MAHTTMYKRENFTFFLLFFYNKHI